MSIICSDCGHDNPEDIQFCDRCGSPLDLEVSIAERFSVIEEELDIDIATKEFSETIDQAIDELDETMQHGGKSGSSSQNFGNPSLIDISTRLEVVPSPSATPVATSVILVLQDTGTKFKLPTTGESINIGRKNEQVPIHVDLSKIEHADLISRFHASIKLKDGLYYLEDMNSSNGTWLNDNLLKPGTRFRQQLRHGDTIAFGRSQTVKLDFYES